MTITSNIHYNLTAWQSSHAYTAGTRASNGGNAYQVTTSGTSASSGGPTGTGATITDGTAVWKWLSAIDFTNLNSWSAFLPTTLAQPYVAQLWNNGLIQASPAGTFLTALSGHNTTASNNITIRPAPGEAFADTLLPSSAVPLAFSANNGVAFQLPTSGTGQFSYFYINDDNVIIYGLQFKDPNSTSTATILAATKNVAVINCIFDGYSQNGSSLIEGGLSGAASAKFQLINNLIIDRSTGGSLTVTATINYNINLSCNTFVLPSASSNVICVIGKGPSGITGTAIDNIFTGYAGNFTVGSDTGTTWNIDYSNTTAASITGTGVTVGSNMLYSKTAASQFVNAATDFRTLAAAPGTNTGSTDTAGNPLQVDILGRARPQGVAWDRGAYEYPQTPSVGTAVGVAVVSATAQAIASTVGTAVGVAIVAGVAPTAGQTAGHAVGSAVVQGVGAATATTAGHAVGEAIVEGVPNFLSILTDIEIDPIAPQLVEQAFTVTGSYTLVPQLQWADDTSTTFQPVTNTPPVGDQHFSFQHRGMPRGTHTITVIETLNGGATAANYLVDIVAQPGAPIYTFPPTGPSTLLKIIPSYVYEEYADDDDIQALNSSNILMQQSMLDWFNNINLPIYTGSKIIGPLLDWVATGLYGIPRPIIAFSSGSSTGTYNTWALNTVPINAGIVNAEEEVFIVNDDIYKRIVTWHFYKGDGYQFTIPWLKRRIMRFLGGTNGVDFNVANVSQCSIVMTTSKVFDIVVSAGEIDTTNAGLLQAGIFSGVLTLPFQYSFKVTV